MEVEGMMTFSTETMIPVELEYDDSGIPELGWIPEKKSFRTYANGVIEFPTDVNIPFFDFSEDDDETLSLDSCELRDGSSAEMDLATDSAAGSVADGGRDTTIPFDLNQLKTRFDPPKRTLL
jgi:hypothetical protein